MDKFEKIIGECVEMTVNATADEVNKMKEVYDRHMESDCSSDFKVLLHLDDFKSVLDFAKEYGFKVERVDKGKGGMFYFNGNKMVKVDEAYFED
ncbi:hypothetical protein [Anaerosporobacter sp.]|uniref:hypothetical protein n=1 Tax=Anaerosporobacter sp. TaxID=1872529 RepID=UPI00286F8368|nr:hypothetical protein [Anaerosporobacter sp.]